MKQSHNRRWRGLARPAAAAVVGVSGAVLTTVLAYRVGGVIGSVIGVGGGVIGAVLIAVAAVIVTIAGRVAAPGPGGAGVKQSRNRRWRGLAPIVAGFGVVVINASGIAALTTVLAWRIGGVLDAVGASVGGGVIGAVLTTVLAVILTLAALWAAMLAVVVAPLEAHSFLSRRLSERWATTGSWRQSAGARVLSLPLRIAFGPRGEDKLEEWLAELAAIESRWARWVYLLDLLFDLPLQARAAREATREGPR